MKKVREGYLIKIKKERDHTDKEKFKDVLMRYVKIHPVKEIPIGEFCFKCDFTETYSFKQKSEKAYVKAVITKESLYDLRGQSDRGLHTLLLIPEDCGKFHLMEVADSLIDIDPINSIKNKKEEYESQRT